jgi:hypothetical protein
MASALIHRDLSTDVLGFHGLAICLRNLILDYEVSWKSKPESPGNCLGSSTGIEVPDLNRLNGFVRQLPVQSDLRVLG